MYMSYRNRTGVFFEYRARVFSEYFLGINILELKNRFKGVARHHKFKALQDEWLPVGAVAS